MRRRDPDDQQGWGEVPIRALEHPYVRLVQALLFAAALLFGLAQLGLLDRGAPEVRVVRVTGEDPVSAAATAAREAYSRGADTVILVGTEALADGVVATGLSGALNAPILLNERDILSPQTRDILRELDATSVVIIGGDGSMRAQVEATLRDEMELEVVRIAGASRFDTADLVARQFALATEPGTLDGLRTAVVVPSTDVEAGLAPGGVAAGRGQALPVLYSQDGGLPQPTLDALTRLGIQQVIAVGGVTGFDGEVVEVVDAVDTATTTSALRGFSPARAVIVPDGDSARALVGAPIAGVESGVLLPYSLAERWLRTACGTVTELFVIAEEQLVSELDVQRLLTAATACDD